MYQYENIENSLYPGYVVRKKTDKFIGETQKFHRYFFIFPTQLISKTKKL